MNRRNNSLHFSFRLLQGSVALLLVFLVIQGIVSWRVCKEGIQATSGLISEGLPSLRYLASFEANQALYRLHLFELMFVQEQDRAAKASQADALERKNRERIEQFRVYCESFASSRAQLTVDKFASIRQSVTGLGSVSIGLSALTMLVVLFSSMQMGRAFTQIVKRLSSTTAGVREAAQKWISPEPRWRKEPTTRQPRWKRRALPSRKCPV